MNKKVKKTNRNYSCPSDIFVQTSSFIVDVQKLEHVGMTSTYATLNAFLTFAHNNILEHKLCKLKTMGTVLISTFCVQYNKNNGPLI